MRHYFGHLPEKKGLCCFIILAPYCLSHSLLHRLFLTTSHPYNFLLPSLLLTTSLLIPFYFPPYSLLLTTSLLPPSLLTTYSFLLLSLLLPTSLLTTSLLIPYSLLLLSFLLTTSLLTPSLLITYYFPPYYSSPYYFPPFSFPTFSSNLSTSHCNCWAMVSCPLSSSMASSALRNGLTSRWLSL